MKILADRFVFIFEIAFIGVFAGRKHEEDFFWDRLYRRNKVRWIHKCSTCATPVSIFTFFRITHYDPLHLLLAVLIFSLITVDTLELDAFSLSCHVHSLTKREKIDNVKK